MVYEGGGGIGKKAESKGGKTKKRNIADPRKIFIPDVVMQRHMINTVYIREGSLLLRVLCFFLYPVKNQKKPLLVHFLIENTCMKYYLEKKNEIFSKKKYLN